MVSTTSRRCLSSLISADVVSCLYQYSDCLRVTVIDALKRTLVVEYQRWYLVVDARGGLSFNW